MPCSSFLQIFIILFSSIGILCLPSYVSTSGSTVSNFTVFSTLDGRIVNGIKANLGEFPHQVSLRRSYSNKHFCGGNLIANQWILTAAHCVTKDNGAKIQPFLVSVVAGQARLNESTDYTQKSAVAAIIVHPEFEYTTLTNDVALIKLTKSLKFDTKYVKAIKMETNMPLMGKICNASGWGYLSEEKPVVSNDLMYVELELLGRPRCQKLLANVTNLPQGMFCAGYETGVKDACKGDSGGGLVCDNTLVGVVSGGEGCARPRLPGLYADVPYYRTWIEFWMFNNNEETTNLTKPNVNIGEKKNNSSNVYLSFSPYYLFAVCILLMSLFDWTTYN